MVRGGFGESNHWLQMFEPDILASMQYMDRWRRGRHGAPEKMLMFAVLEDAISRFQHYSSASSRHGKALFREVEIWLMVEKSDRLFSFESLCEVLGFDPDYIRAGLTRWRNNSPGPPAKTRMYHVVRPGRQTREKQSPASVS